MLQYVPHSLIYIKIKSFVWWLSLSVCVCVLNTKILLGIVHHIEHDTDFGTLAQPELLAMPTDVYEFDNDLRYCVPGVTQSECQGIYSTSPYWCADVTTHVQTKFTDIVNGGQGQYDWMNAGATGCCVRGGGGQLSGNEYYRLACTCSTDSVGDYVDGYWRVYYFAENTCDTLVAQTLDRPAGYCGSASSVSVSLFASLVAVFAALKSM